MGAQIVFGQIANVFVEVEQGRDDTAESKDLINHYTLFFVYIAVVALVTWSISTAGFVHTGAKITRTIKSRYFEAVLRQNIAVFDDIGTGSIVTQLTADANVIQEGLSHKLSLSISAIGTLVATFAVTFSLNWIIALMLIWSFVLGVGLLIGGHKIAVRYGGQAMESYSEGGAIVEEALGSIKSTTALGIQSYICKSYEKYLAMAERSAFILKSLMGSLVGLAIGNGYLNVALAFWQGSRYLTRGKTSFPDVTAITLITKSAAFCVLGVGQNAEAFTSAIAAGRRLLRMISRISPTDPTSIAGLIPKQLNGNISFEKVKHVYPSRPNVIVTDGLDVCFPKGQTTAVVGSSGSGKSSIANLILRFYDPIRGTIRLDGHDIRFLNIKWLRQQVRIVNQDPFLFDTSIHENIMYGLASHEFEQSSSLSEEEKETKIRLAAQLACAHDFVEALPRGYDTTVGSRGSKLSGGQKQRIAIARALVAEPRILILDEATSSLDSTTEAKIHQALSKSTNDRTTIIIAHRLSTIRDAQNIVVLSQGQVVEQGVHSELMAAEGAYFNLVQAQTFTDHEDSTQMKDHDLGKADTEILEPSTDEKGPTRQENNELSISPTIEENSKSSILGLASFAAKLNGPEWHLVLIGLFASIIAGLEEPSSAILFGKALVSISQPLELASNIRSDAGFYSWMFFLLALVMLIVYCLQGAIFAYCSEHLIHRARSLALQKMLSMEVAFFDHEENSSGALASFLSTQTTDLAGISGATLGTILIAISTLFSSFVVGVAFGWKLGLVCSAVIPVLVACGFLGVWFVGEFEQQTESFAAASAGYASEAVSAIQTIAALTRESDTLAAFRAMLDASSRQALVSNLRASFLFGLTQAGFYACMALGFWYGGTLIVDHEYSLFQFTVVYSAVIIGAFSAGLVFSFTPNIGKAKRSALALKKLLSRHSKIDPESVKGSDIGNLQGQIEFRNVGFAYPTRPEQSALRDVSFAIPAGGNIAIVGPTGCGKSTIVSLIARFYDSSSGSILIDSTPISSLNIAKYRRSIGFVNQEPTLYNGSIKTNLTAGLDDEQIPDSAIENVCKQANIHDFIKSLPDGLNTMVGNRGNQLSGGQKQRIALARALIRNPKVLILDEATSAIDSQSEVLIQEALDQARKGRTTITIAHRLSTIQKADMIYVLDHGEIVEAGTHAELIARKNMYHQLYVANLGGQIL